MIYFIYGEDSYRLKNKLEEMITGYKKVRKSGLNLIYIDAENKGFKEFYSQLQINSMFAEKKFIVLRNTFENEKFQEEFLENIKKLGESEDIIVIYEDGAPDQRTKFFKALQKNAKCQEFKYLQLAEVRKWVAQEFEKNKTKINIDAIDLLINFVGSDLWAMTNEINKLSNYKAGSIINKNDVEKLVKPNIENDIFKTIDAIASKNKKQALFLLHKHLDDGEAPLRLLSMIAYQFRNFLIIKDLQEKQSPYGVIAKTSICSSEELFYVSAVYYG
ncbi:MAG: DNA polymerase III subunit delta [Candidatus Staskawiczbacteria bacterium]|nr:DNA polymerase III subunit delta [Candidatus Staskawiczbacteria bacterium]